MADKTLFEVGRLNTDAKFQMVDEDGVMSLRFNGLQIIEVNVSTLDFQSGTYNFYGTTSGAAALNIYEDADNGLHYVGLKAPASMATNYDITLPDAQGSAGDVAVNDGSGGLSWIPAQARSVKEWGATGDGTTDDTVAIRNAADAVGTGGTLYFPDGTYIVSDVVGTGNFATGLRGVEVKDGQTWCGPGTIKLADGVENIRAVVGFVVGASDFTIKDLTFDGNRDNQSPSVDLFTSFFMIEGPQQGKRGLYKNLKFKNCLGRALQSGISSSGVGRSEDMIIEGCRVENSGTKALSMTLTDRGTIANCVVEVDAYTAAQNPNGSEGATSGSCFECNNSANISIIGNQGIQVGSTVQAPGIRCTNGSNQVTISNNTITGANYGVFTSNTDYAVISNNTFKDIVISNTVGGVGILAAHSTQDVTESRIFATSNYLVNIEDSFFLANATQDDSGDIGIVNMYATNNTCITESGESNDKVFTNNGFGGSAAGSESIIYQWDNILDTPATVISGSDVLKKPYMSGNSTSAFVLLEQDAVEQSTNATGLSTIYQYTVPGNTLQANGRLRIKASFRVTSSNNNKNVQVRYGGIALTTDASNSTSDPTTFTVEVEVANRNATNSQHITNGYDSAGNPISTTAIDTTANKTVAFTCNNANAADTIYLDSYTIELFQQT